MALVETDGPFDEFFVQGAARHEESAEVRIAAVRRVASGHGRAQAWRAPTTYATPPRRRSDRRGVLAGVAAVVLVVAVALVAPQSLGLGLGAVPAVAAPPRPVDAAAQRLLPAVLAPAGRGGWRPLAQDPATGEVLRFDPCRPLHYVVRAGLEPPGGARTLDAAVQELSKDTGLVLVSDGATSEPPSGHRPAVEPARYGNRWAPVLIAWSTPAESAELAGDVDGYAGPQVGFDGRQHLVSGQVVLDAAQLTTPAGALPRIRRRCTSSRTWWDSGTSRTPSS